MSWSEERKPFMIACQGVPCASAISQAMATAEVIPDTSLEAGESNRLRHHALRGVRPRQLPAPGDDPDLALKSFAARAQQHVDHSQTRSDQRH